jgi:hypothetical protein
MIKNAELDLKDKRTALTDQEKFDVINFIKSNKIPDSAGIYSINIEALALNILKNTGKTVDNRVVSRLLNSASLPYIEPVKKRKHPSKAELVAAIDIIQTQLNNVERKLAQMKHDHDAFCGRVDPNEPLTEAISKYLDAPE